MTGCELIKCPFYVDGCCTDPDPMYEHICRYNELLETLFGALQESIKGAVS